MTMVGDAKYVNGEKFDTEMTLDSSLLKSPIVLKGKYDYFVAVDSPLDIVCYECSITVYLFSFKGTVDNASTKNKNRWDTDMVFRSPMINTKVAGFTQTKDGLLSTRMEFRYDYNDASKHQFIVNGKMKDMSKAKLSKYIINT